MGRIYVKNGKNVQVRKSLYYPTPLWMQRKTGGGNNTLLIEAGNATAEVNNQIF